MTERAGARMERNERGRRFSRTEAICLLAFALMQTSIALAGLIVAVTHG
jgi:hypothetical protein